MVASCHQEGRAGPEMEPVRWNQSQERDLVSMTLVGRLDQDVPEVHATLETFGHIYMPFSDLSHFQLG